ncbi:uncharacterized protein LOC143899325 isoform X2 [Temnothorax americanus]|uniref:uncharacterized protein LOC143899325 isoform X2 n=1 Tax=Temnothorax americanus TaxID=1964332 RepID=UPI004067F49F
MIFICVILKKDNNVMLFVERTLNKCKEVLKVRQDKSLTFYNVNLPLATNTIEGYHVKCYRKFTALGKRFRLTAERQTSETSDSSNANTQAAKEAISINEPSDRQTSSTSSTVMPDDVHASTSTAKIAVSTNEPSRPQIRGSITNICERCDNSTE